jgi:nucleotide-binding universal stress UspA family protein
VEIHHILCPSDFSEASAHAVDQAIVLADAYKAKIIASLAADVIVMGTHGTSGFEHFVLGSVTEKVLRKATCPVLTVPPRAQATSRLPFQHVLCAVDFSDASTAAVNWATSLAHASGASVTLLHVLEWPWHEPPPPDMSQLPKEQADALVAFRRYSEGSARTRLESLVPQHVRTVQTVAQLRNGKAWSEILDVARDQRSDLIIMGVRGRNPVDVTLFGSTTNQVVRRASCPVLTVH